MKKKAIDKETFMFAEVELKYVRQQRLSERVPVRSSKDAYFVAKHLWSDDISFIEETYCIYTDVALNVIGWSRFTKGSGRGVLFDIKRMVQVALKLSAHGVVVIHNHPSGNLMPSTSDKNVSDNLRDALKLIDMVLLDSMIITEEGYFSLSDHSLI